MTYQILFSGKNISKCLLKILPRVLGIKGIGYTFRGGNSCKIDFNSLLKSEKRRDLVLESKPEVMKVVTLVQISRNLPNVPRPLNQFMTD